MVSLSVWSQMHFHLVLMLSPRKDDFGNCNVLPQFCQVIALLKRHANIINLFGTCSAREVGTCCGKYHQQNHFPYNLSKTDAKLFFFQNFLFLSRWKNPWVKFFWRPILSKNSAPDEWMRTCIFPT